MANNTYSKDLIVINNSFGKVMQGVVKWYDPKRGFGYITEIRGEIRYGMAVAVEGMDFFFHISKVLNSSLPEKGDQVTFQLYQARNEKRGPVAVEVKITKSGTQALRVNETRRAIPHKPAVGRGEHCRMCNTCQKKVFNTHTHNGVAYFRCNCGARFTGKVFTEPVPEQTSGAAMAIGATIGGGLGGVPGMIIGALIGGICGTGEVTSNCRKCGTSARPQGKKGNRIHYQCPTCLKTWIS